jgi:hypothetical protein
MVPCAYLRVFEPLDAFPETERERWGRYVASGNGLSVRAAVTTEAAISMSRLLTGRQPTLGETALVRRVGRRTHLCPLQLEERSAVALLAFRDMVPAPALDAFVTPGEARSAVVAAERLARPPHILEASWEVPLRWFVAFTPAERHLVDPPDGPGPRLSYLTTNRSALSRLDRAVDIVDATIEDGDDIVEALVDLIDWLTSFDEDSLLELDYGGLSSMLSGPDLATDMSCEEIWAVLDSLERGDAVTALAGYETVAARWQRMRSQHRTN